MAVISQLRIFSPIQVYNYISGGRKGHGPISVDRGAGRSSTVLISMAISPSYKTLYRLLSACLIIRCIWEYRAPESAEYKIHTPVELISRSACQLRPEVSYRFHILQLYR
jgi:hypothetical protein